MDDFRPLKEILSSYGLNYTAGETSRFWGLDLQKLDRCWSGDPREIYQGVKNYNDIYERIVNKGFNPRQPYGFIGFQKKLASMLTHFLRREEMVPKVMFPPPTDVHVTRVLLEHGIITIDNVENQTIYAYRLHDTIRDILTRYCRKYDIDPLDLGAALWILSRTLCTRYPGNRTLRGENQGRHTELIPAKVEWDKHPALRGYLRSCGACPVRETCMYSIPSMPNNEKGAVEIRGRKQKPTQGLINFDL